MTGESTKPGEEQAQGEDRGPWGDGYREPLPLATCSIHELITMDPRVVQRRIRDLEEALLPLAAHGGLMHSIRMNARAHGMPRDVCCGGTWLLQDGGPMALYTEREHLAALDAVGRERTRRYMAEQVALRAEAKARHDAGLKTN